MKKTAYVLFLGLMMAGLAGCSGEEPEVSKNEGQMTYVANPWQQTSNEDIIKEFGVSFGIPEGAEDVSFSKNISTGLLEMRFKLNGVEWNARIAKSDEYFDISGMYYTWNVEKQSDALSVNGTEYYALSDAEHVCNATWFNKEKGLIYSLSCVSEKEETFDIAKEIFE